MQKKELHVLIGSKGKKNSVKLGRIPSEYGVFVLFCIMDAAGRTAAQYES